MSDPWPADVRVIELPARGVRVVLPYSTRATRWMGVLLQIIALLLLGFAIWLIAWHHVLSLKEWLFLILPLIIAGFFTLLQGQGRTNGYNEIVLTPQSIESRRRVWLFSRQQRRPLCDLRRIVLVSDHTHTETELVAGLSGLAPMRLAWMVSHHLLWQVARNLAERADALLPGAEVKAQGESIGYEESRNFQPVRSRIVLSQRFEDKVFVLPGSRFRQLTITASSERLMISEKRLFRTVVRRWSRDELSEIRLLRRWTKPGGRYVIALCIKPITGGEVYLWRRYGLARGLVHAEWEWLAHELRAILNK